MSVPPGGLMFTNYFNVAIRNLLRHKGYSFINIAGLAIGIACCLLIFLYVQDELSFDRHHENADRIYRLIGEYETGGQVIQTAGTPAPWAPALRRDYPEVENTVRMRGTITQWLITAEDRRFYEKRLYWAEETLFDIFSIPLLSGDPRTALKEPYSIVISETLAKKYFGDEDPMGKVVNGDNIWDFTVTGVMQDMPRNVHFHADMFASYTSLTAISGEERVSDWLDHQNFYTYLLLKEDVPPEQLEQKFPAFIETYMGDQIREAGMQLRPSLQALTDIHLTSHRDGEFEPNSDRQYVYIFTIVAVFVLLIACINFMNLATARSAMRAREIGMRKVLGAYRRQLMRQFMGEAILLALLATGLAVVVAWLMLPVFQTISGKTLALQFNNHLFIASIVTLPFLVGLISGSYPAMFLSAFEPVDVLKGKVKSNASGIWLRKMLVVLQFSLSIFLIIGTGVVFDQLSYIQTRRLGFDKERVVVIPILSFLQGRQSQPYKGRLIPHPEIVSVTTSTGVPGDRLLPIHPVRPEGMDGNEQMMMATFQVDYDFLETMDMDLVAGRNFSTDYGTDSTVAFILNETAVRQLGWGTPLDALGRSFAWLPFGGVKGQIIGVVKDFHLRTFHQEIEPVVIFPSSYYSYILIRIRPEGISETLEMMKQIWEDIAPTFPFQYSFLDEDFDSLYRADQQVGQIFGAFALLAVCIACLGLFGLASFTTEQRAREIGIRKVLGASVSGIVVLLSKEFALLVLLANVIAWPVAYITMNSWLQDFAYHTDVRLWMFVLSGLLALAIAWATVSIQAIRAAWSNPVKTLRYE